MSDRDSDVA